NFSKLHHTLFLQVDALFPHIHTFPTRRSSDLCDAEARLRSGFQDQVSVPLSVRAARLQHTERPGQPVVGAGGHGAEQYRPTHARSEEHTSELQSRFDLVCRLLLEKKNRTRCWP